MLKPEDRALLDFERCSISMAGPKDWNIENVLGLSADHYYNRLRDMAFNEEAAAYDGFTTRRIAHLIEEGSLEKAAG